jgi:signal recognition particle subunit SEC65
MKPENEKYDKVLDLLRKSKPQLDSSVEIEREVGRRIQKSGHLNINLSEVAEFLFGWVYIVWVRRSLITASIVLVMIFIYQQGIILNRIDSLSKQTIVTGRENVLSPANEIEKLLTTYKNSGRIFPSKTITITESQMKELLESVKELQIKYKDLENVIDSDPELKKLIDSKLLERNRTKINL